MGILNWYHPRTATDAPESQVLESWGEDYGMTTIEIQNLSARERADALVALHSLSVGFTQKIEPDYSNPYWMEDEGYRDNEDDTKTLATISRQVFDRRPPIPEDTWRYFDQFPEGADACEYKVVPVDRLIQTNPPSEPVNPTSVLKAYVNLDALARREEIAEKISPQSVRDYGDGKYSMIEGNEILAVAKWQGWKELPVRIRPVLQLPSGGLWFT